MRPVIFLNSHPIQYFAPLYQDIAATTTIPLTVWYCSDESIKGKVDKGFGKSVKWDIPLLDGYNAVFIKNISWKPSINSGFFGLVNMGVIRMLYRQPKSVIVIHGWAYFTNLIAIIFAKLFGHTVCLRAETPLNQEHKKNAFKRFIKNIYLRFLFLFIDHFLFIGKQNKLFYASLGVREKKMMPAPYCVDNKRFRKIFLTNDKDELKQKLNLPLNKKIILYSGKYIDKKRPMDLLQAFDILKRNDAILVFVGDGELRSKMQAYIDEHQMSNVILTGFINQTEIPAYYRAADIFVMCSGMGETWGLSVNEAMNFGLPVIVSDTCGCAYDLIDVGKNGAIFETGNIKILASELEKYLDKTVEEINEIRAASLEKIDQYSYSQVIDAIERISA